MQSFSKLPWFLLNASPFLPVAARVLYFSTSISRVCKHSRPPIILGERRTLRAHGKILFFTAPLLNMAFSGIYPVAGWPRPWSGTLAPLQRCGWGRWGRGSEDGGTMLLIRMYVTRFP